MHACIRIHSMYVNETRHTMVFCSSSLHLLGQHIVSFDRECSSHTIPQQLVAAGIGTPHDYCSNNARGTFPLYTLSPRSYEEDDRQSDRPIRFRDPLYFCGPPSILTAGGAPCLREPVGRLCTEEQSILCRPCSPLLHSRRPSLNQLMTRAHTGEQGEVGHDRHRTIASFRSADFVHHYLHHYYSFCRLWARTKKTRRPTPAFQAITNEVVITRGCNACLLLLPRTTLRKSKVW